MAMRSGRDDDDWDDEYDDEDDEPRAAFMAQQAEHRSPSGPAPGTGPTGSPPAEEEEQEDTSWIVDQRMDDDGTEWAQSGDGTWYYRESGQSDWIPMAGLGERMSKQHSAVLLCSLLLASLSRPFRQRPLVHLRKSLSQRHQPQFHPTASCRWKQHFTTL